VWCERRKEGCSRGMWRYTSKILSEKWKVNVYSELSAVQDGVISMVMLEVKNQV
jgi:hypothetical protein